MRICSQLTVNRRYQIPVLRKAKMNQVQIASLVRVHPSTISRELRRNRTGGQYEPGSAHVAAWRRRYYAKKAVKMPPPVRLVIVSIVAVCICICVTDTNPAGKGRASLNITG